MNEIELTTALRAQMRGFTSADAPPADLVRRVHAGVRRTRQHRIAVVAGVAVASGVASVALAAGGPSREPQQLQVARSAGPTAQPTAPPAPAAAGPSDDQLRRAEWFSYESRPEQPDTDREPEQRWEHRDGRHLARWADGDIEVVATDSRFPLGEAGVTWDELLALPADPVELERRMRAASGGRPPEERVLDQVRQLLARSPALQTVRKALVDAAAAQQGSRLREGQRDSLGRPATLLERTDRDGAVLQLWIDPVGFRLLEERTVAGPDFPTPPTEGPAPEQDSYDEGDLLYREVFLRWSTAGPPA